MNKKYVASSNNHDSKKDKKNNTDKYKNKKNTTTSEENKDSNNNAVNNDSKKNDSSKNKYNIVKANIKNIFVSDKTKEKSDRNEKNESSKSTKNTETYSNVNDKKSNELSTKGSNDKKKKQKDSKKDSKKNSSNNNTVVDISDEDYTNDEGEINKPKKNWKGRTFSRFTPGGVRSSTVLFICTAIGVGFLSIPYVFSKLGIILSIILIILNALESYVTTNILCTSSLEHNTFVYGNLLKKIGNKYDKTIIDFGLSFGFISSYILILILISNFLSTIFYVFNFPTLFTNNIFLVILICLLILPITFRNKVGSLNHFLIFSLFSLSITVLTIGLQTKSYNNLLINREVNLFTMDKHFFKCFNILLFSFSQQPNACFITGQFNQPTHRRLNKSTFRSVMLQVIFYTLFGVLGYFSFLNTAKDNIVLNYENSNVSILLCKFLLSLTFFFSVPLNFMGSYQSMLALGITTRDALYKLYTYIFRRTGYSANLSLLLSEYTQDPYQETHADNITEHSSVSESQEDDQNQRMWVSIIVTIFCALIACKVKKLSNVIGIGGGITSTLISCLLPNIIYYKNRHNVSNKLKRYSTLFMLCFFSFMGFLSVVVTTLNLIL
ncbi:putative amino acid transporter [Plasmodium gaboni]|uniref:Putative amino acid transporter n=1 Tax=Plasmodium gaboni TaxID=647221 RepID=A0A151LS54_9APIC|nr:putative amino acid transporter [Plasmodium gaboni]KYO01992.1 putative amino acid transporter [Plasmodium gaboni]